MEHITFENALLIGSLLLVAGILIGKTGYRTGLPLLLIIRQTADPDVADKQS